MNKQNYYYYDLDLRMVMCIAWNCLVCCCYFLYFFFLVNKHLALTQNFSVQIHRLSELREIALYLILQVADGKKNTYLKQSFPFYSLHAITEADGDRLPQKILWGLQYSDIGKYQVTYKNIFKGIPMQPHSQCRQCLSLLLFQSCSF